VLGVAVLYLATASTEMAVRRHAVDGYLSRFAVTPTIVESLEVYSRPAKQLATCPPVGWVLTIMSDFWCDILRAPETTA
jgi:hypothetical protein